MDTSILLKIVILVAVIVGGYFVIRAKRYTQTLFGIAMVAAIGCVIAGFVLLSDSKDTNDTASAILLIGGIIVILGGAVGAKFLFSSRPPST